MPAIAFDMTTANHQSRRFEFRGKNNADYYEGDLEPITPGEVDTTLEKSVAGELSVYLLRSRSGLAFRRSWSHIRKDKTDVTVFWFVRQGQVTISDAGGRNVIHADQCAITRSSKPFYMDVRPEGGQAELMHVVVPSHRLYPAIDDAIGAGRAFPTSRGNLLLAERILTLLFEQDGEIDPATADELVQTLLNGVGKAIAAEVGEPAQRATIADRRLADITRYINQHFANPDLNAKMVAEGCGISVRYLCLVLKRNDLSFSKIVWERRMATAHDWLREKKMRHHAIGEIAYLVGFKSDAHFSRMFKKRFGIAPRDHRNQGLREG
jgi:AraC family transcriptional regulator, positive regulator of tynA and feaB